MRNSDEMMIGKTQPILFYPTLKTYFIPFSVYIWTLFGISWLVGLISLIINSASKVTLKTLPKNFKNREEKNCVTHSESEQLCKQHRILSDTWYHVIIHFQVQTGFPVRNHFNKRLCIKKIIMSKPDQANQSVYWNFEFTRTVCEPHESCDLQNHVTFMWHSGRNLLHKNQLI